MTLAVDPNLAGEALRRETDTLRIATAGSVDDGKSTLIGRLLYDSKAILEDQLDAVERTSAERGDGRLDLALLTDGLRAEREQGITIDVAYRYFATARRRFILADTPGHVQYTRNMVTGASTADVAVVLVDARGGVTEQSKRHAFVSDLLGIRRFVLCVNKMDLVGFDEERFTRIAGDFTEFAARLDGRPEIDVVPISALHGDNVVDRSERTPWYDGPALLALLEQLDVPPRAHGTGFRFPVQYVIRPHDDRHHDFRGYAGQIAAGVLRPGDEVVVLPAGLRTRIAAVETFDGRLEAAPAPMSVTVLLEDDVDVSRGDLLADPADAPEPAREIEATVCWMSERPLRARGRYVLKHTTRSVRAIVEEVADRVDVDTLDRQPAPEGLALNDIGRVRLRTSSPLAADPYARSRTTGGFILIDQASNETVGAGMVLS